jgi:hypothetical protein
MKDLRIRDLTSSLPRSNRACSFPAHGSPTGFTKGVRPPSTTSHIHHLSDGFIYLQTPQLRLGAQGGCNDEFQAEVRPDSSGSTKPAEPGGSTCPDAIIVGSSASVRAERSGRGDGRVYHLTYRAEDGMGGECTGMATVCVPHDQRRGVTCIDQGPLFDSTRCE